ncbi:MAG: FtsX-like permease family protein [Deltaproteobacteria bacterium]|nr:FtsX-like permease family protein [Deltaproteobacteria bacterium]
MTPLNTKLTRDLWRMKGQVLAIVIVILCGIATFIMFMSNMDSLTITRDKFYREYVFADVFANLKRAPESIKERIAAIPGVALVETRITAGVKLAVPRFEEPVTAQIISLPDNGKPLINKVFIRKGRLPDAEKDDEVMVGDTFAEAHGFALGDRFGAVINGKWKQLTIVGVGLSPEYVLQLRPGAISPDYKRYGILWMTKSTLATAYDMKGAFNDVVLTCAPHANENDIIRQLDNILDRYGSFGSYDRNDQMSHRFLNEEFRGLENFSFIFPTIFIAVAAFLLNVVISRTVNTQREQVAVLKAFGYGNIKIGWHYFKFVLVIVLLGIAGGTALGAWLGKLLGDLYMEFYRFPYLIFRLDIKIFFAAVVISLAAALAGTIQSIRAAAKLPPAEAMRPEQPAKYRKAFFERIGLARFLSQPARIIARNLQRKPLRTLLSIIGIAFACATMISSGFFKDAVDYMVHVQFSLAQREDMKVTFIEPTSHNAVYALKGVRGIEHAEGYRSVPARLRFGHRSYKTAIEGIERGSTLQYILDENLKPIYIPPSGIVLTDYLAEYLGIGPGDMLTVEVLEGERPVRQVPVVALAKQYMGLMGYMDTAALNHLMREGNAISGVSVVVDPLYKKDIYKKLIQMPRVAGAVVIKDEIRSFYDTQAEAMLIFTFIATLMAGAITFGVVYNSARIALSERSRELSSLRVLGYTRGEISYILLGELALITLAAIPVGFLIGRVLCIYIARMAASDIFRIPVVIEPATYSLAAAVVVASAAISGLIVRHRLDHLDLIEVLKARE